MLVEQNHRENIGNETEEIFDPVKAEEFALSLERENTLFPQSHHTRRNPKQNENGVLDVTGIYFHEMGRVPLLSTEEEVNLAKRISNATEENFRLTYILLQTKTLKAKLDAQRATIRPIKNPQEYTRLAHISHRLQERQQRLHTQLRKTDAGKAVEKLTAANLRLVISVAKRYIDRGLPLLDLIQEGNIGLIRAVEKYDWTKGLKFSTYAPWWILQAISRAVIDKGRTIRLPVHTVEQLNKIRSERQRLTQELGRDPSEVELASALDMTVERLLGLEKASHDAISLEAPMNDVDTTLKHIIADSSMFSTVDAASQKLLKDQIKEVLEVLTERERRILQLRYGLGDGIQHTLVEIGKELGISRERVRQLEIVALHKIRTSRRVKNLSEYLE